MNAPWLKTALLGVDKVPASLPLSGNTGAFCNLVASRGEPPALGLSQAIGAWSACRLAAVDTLQPVEPAPPAPAKDASLNTRHPWFHALTQIVNSAPLRLQFEACRLLANMGATLPHILLPAALQAGERSQALREALQPALGPRGYWLARFNKSWHFAVQTVIENPETDEQQLWDEGSPAQRRRFFRKLRQRDPAAARILLKDGLPAMPAKEQQEFVALLEIGLEAEDEMLLAPLLNDRSRDVRQLAGGLLALLPDSRHAERLAGWMSGLVTSERRFLQRVWRCEPPETADPEWSKAGIEIKRPQNDALGERAWWLYQLARQIPLPWWQAHTGMRPEELIAWAKKGNWTEALYRAWMERVRENDSDWIEAMLDSPMVRHQQDRIRLLTLLPVAARERVWPQTMQALMKDGLLTAMIETTPLGDTLSAGLSQNLIGSLRDYIESDRIREHYHIRPQLLELACLLHPSGLRGWQPLKRAQDETPAMTECITDFERIVALRRTLHAPLS